MPIDPHEPIVEGEKNNEGATGGSLEEVIAPIASRKESNLSLFVYTIVAIGIALFVRFFIAAPYLVSGPSMEDTFYNHDYLIIDRLTYRLSTPERGDVVVFSLPQKNGETLIKRIIGLPGDTVTVSDSGVTIANAANPKGFKLTEPYLSPDNLGGLAGMTVTLGPDHYYVMGDNRRVSFDSRSWGALSGDNIVGRVIVRLYPFSDVGILPGEARYSSS